MKTSAVSCLIFLFLLICCPRTTTAQTDSGFNKKNDSTLVKQTDQQAKEDEEFNVFLISIAAFFACAMIGAAIIGSFVATMILLLMFAFLSAGILSVSMVAGFYRRSFQFGFKTFVVILSCLAGVIIGSFGLLIVPRLFNISISNQKALIVGGIGGAVGGIIMGLIIYQALKYSAIYFWKKYYHQKRNPDQ